MKCGSVECTRAATTLCAWPGQTTAKCDECSVKLSGIASAMGIDLHCSPLPAETSADRVREAVRIVRSMLMNRLALEKIVDARATADMLEAFAEERAKNIVMALSGFTL